MTRVVAVVPKANGQYFASTIVLELNINNYIVHNINNYKVHHSSGIIIVIGIEYKLYNYYTMSIVKVDGASGITDLSIKQRAFTYEIIELN